MRAIATVVLLGLIAARPAAAEPQASPGEDKQKQQKQPPKQPPKQPQKQNTAPGLGLGLGGMAAQATTSGANQTGGAPDATFLDLTPQRLFESGTLDSEGDRRGTERRSGLGLGNDGDWRVQAAQVGVMVGVFGALVAACADGGCLLPEFFGSRDRLGPSEDLQIRDPGPVRDGR